MLFAGIHLPEYAMDIVTTLGDITIPLSMILVGVQLGGADFKKLIADKALLITSVMKLIAVPALALLILTPMPVDPVVKLTVLLGMCFPSAVIGVAVAAQENKNPQLMAEAVAITTLLSLITLPVWIIPWRLSPLLPRITLWFRTLPVAKMRVLPSPSTLMPKLFQSTIL